MTAGDVVISVLVLALCYFLYIIRGELRRYYTTPPHITVEGSISRLAREDIQALVEAVVERISVTKGHETDRSKLVERHIRDLGEVFELTDGDWLFKGYAVIDSPAWKRVALSSQTARRARRGAQLEIGKDPVENK